ncbi:MAG TPA: metallophosphoesterase [Gaiellaceae bacterium]|nr:metallophosphoesterase [Gaiellaceae bacterium]
MAWVPVAVAVVAAAGLAWALFEAQWVEYLERDAPVVGLPPELDGFRVLHISDFHLGTLSLNGRALRKAVDWAYGRDLDLVAVTGDLVSRRRGVRTLACELGRLRSRHGTFAVLGNHDVASTRDPFSRPADLSAVDEAVLLEHESVVVEHGGRRVQVAGGDPRRHLEPHGPLADPAADLRLLLVHFPDEVRELAPGEFHLVLAGHLHAGQICIPTPGGKVRLEHLRAPYWEGVFELPQATLHVSRGLGTSFVPFRFLARPEATILTLRSGE